jgi:ABC-type antimicrobial peptide transport system permease subunit
MLAAALLILAVTAGAAMTVVSTLSGLRDRRTELALRRAIGATKGDVVCQVAIESTALGLLGGVLGICVGVLTTTAIALARHWQAVMDPLAVVIALTVAVGLGVVTGATAAVRAAQVDPAEAIRI